MLKFLDLIFFLSWLYHPLVSYSLSDCLPLFTFACVTLPFYWLSLTVLCVCVLLALPCSFAVAQIPTKLQNSLMFITIFPTTFPTHSLPSSLLGTAFFCTYTRRRRRRRRGGTFCLCDYYVIMEIMALLCRVEIIKF